MPLGTICCRGLTLIRLRSDVITSFSFRDVKISTVTALRQLTCPFFHLPPLPGKERNPSASSIYGQETFIFYPLKKKKIPILHYRSWLVEWLLICSLHQCFYFLPKHFSEINWSLEPWLNNFQAKTSHQWNELKSICQIIFQLEFVKIQLVYQNSMHYLLTFLSRFRKFKNKPHELTIYIYT